MIRSEHVPLAREQVTSQQERGESELTGSASGRWLLCGLVALAAMPLVVSLVLFSHRLWTEQWSEIPVAFGWSAPHYPWMVQFQQGPDAERSNAFDKLFVSPPGSDSERAARLQGAWLAVRERWDVFGADPMGYVLASELSRDGRLVIAESRDVKRFDARLSAALAAVPHDVFLKADSMFGWSEDPFHSGISAEVQPVQSDGDDNSKNVALDEPAVNLWRLLVDAGAVLAEHGNPRVYTMWIQSANTPSMWARLAPSPTATAGTPWLDDAGERAYAEAIEKLAAAPAEQFLESAFENRAERAWATLGLEPQAARYAARSERGAPALLVGWHCAQHLELMEQIVGQAIKDGDFEKAAHWVELAEQVALVLKDSVKTPGVFNYLQSRHAAAGGLAQIVQTDANCPPEVATRMAAVVARSPLTVPKSGQMASIAPVIYFDNVARGCLSIVVVTLAAAAIGWLHLRSRRRRENAEQVPRPARPRGTLVVAAAAFVGVAAILAGLEATNFVGEHLASNCYALSRIVLLLAVTGRLGWLAVAEMSHGRNTEEHRLRRRLTWLVSFMVLLAVMRYAVSLAGPGQSSGWLATLDRLGEHSGLPAIVGLFFGILLPVVAVAFSILRWRRWRREPGEPPLLHPAFVAFVAIAVGLWLVLGPPDEWLHGWRTTAYSGTSWTPIMEATDSVGASLQGPTWGPLTLSRGLNPLTIALAVRMTNLGLWLVLACVVLWGVIFLHPSWSAWCARAGQAIADRRTADRAWLAAVMWSCLWIGLTSLAMHTWCTLGLSYYVNQMLNQS